MSLTSREAAELDRWITREEPEPTPYDDEEGQHERDPDERDYDEQKEHAQELLQELLHSLHTQRESRPR